MLCKKCGYENTDDTPYCVQCGEPLFMRAKHPTHEQGERKVIKLPSDGAEEEAAPIERPWEVRVPKRNTSNPGNSGKMSSTRKKAGKTGKIPPVPAPGAPESKEGAQGKDGSKSKAVVGASIGGAAADTLILKPAPAPGETRADPTPRRKIQDAPAKISTRGNGGGKSGGNGKKIGAIIGILLICCLVIAGVLFATSGKGDKTVIFETNGGSAIAEQTIIDGGQLNRPSTPTRDGYTFDGWYLDADLSDPAHFPISVTKDMKLYAKWTAKPESTISAGSSASSAPSAAPADASVNNGSQGGGNSGGYAAGGAAGGATAGSGAASGGSSGSGGTSGGGTSGGSSGDGNHDQGDGTSARVSVITKGGETLSGTVRLTNGYVIPDSSKKAYSIEELRALNLNPAELSIARNEIYAREGYSFRNSGLQKYFNARSWYHNRGWRGDLPAGSAGYITAHNILELERSIPSAAAWLNLKMS